MILWMAHIQYEDFFSMVQSIIKFVSNKSFYLRQRIMNSEKCCSKYFKKTDLETPMTSNQNLFQQQKYLHHITSK